MLEITETAADPELYSWNIPSVNRFPSRRWRLTYLETTVNSPIIGWIWFSPSIICGPPQEGMIRLLLGTPHITVTLSAGRIFSRVRGLIVKSNMSLISLLGFDAFLSRYEIPSLQTLVQWALALALSPAPLDICDALDLFAPSVLPLDVRDAPDVSHNFAAGIAPLRICDVLSVLVDLTAFFLLFYTQGRESKIHCPSWVFLKGNFCGTMRDNQLTVL
ncbi:hypothetical protein PENSTE_c002G08888 [Penicillium steckii]|uniref:Uncharacterized protein n=1 Tax=Penicillium steckii TaxID=303698 RepID=A0A1V6TU02_9EURO|nr:hypothetical protein PENSTE_c002G08888 [Penicillium steckii]